MNDAQERNGAKPVGSPEDAQQSAEGNTPAGTRQPAEDGLEPENVNPLAPPINVEAGG